MRKHNRGLLVDLLKAITNEWGFEETQNALEELLYGKGEGRQRSAENSERLVAQERDSRRPKKLTAVEQVYRLSAAESEKNVLLTIARKFDQKEFLPSIADVREFLAMTSEEPHEGLRNLKDRSDAFRKVLTSLAHAPVERLAVLAESARYSGPSQLGPLSEAIKSAGQAMRREDPPEEAKGQPEDSNSSA